MSIFDHVYWPVVTCHLDIFGFRELRTLYFSCRNADSLRICKSWSNTWIMVFPMINNESLDI